MCNPFGNALIGAASGAASIYSQHKEGKRAAKLQRAEARRLQGEAAESLKQTYADEAVFRQQSNARTASARTRLSHAGITASGSAEDVLADRQADDEYDVLRNRYRGLRNANDIYRRSRDLRKQSKRTLASTYFNTGQSIINQAPGIISAFPE